MLYDYYKLLGIDRTANVADIKKAYRAKAKVCHPDINRSPKATEVFSLLNEANQILTNQNKRQKYDSVLNATYYTLVSEKVAKGHKKDPHFWRTRFNINYNDLFGKEFQTRSHKSDLEISPLIFQVLLLFGVFFGFVIIFVPLLAVIYGIWSPVLIFISAPGIFIIKEGCTAIVGNS